MGENLMAAPWEQYQTQPTTEEAPTAEAPPVEMAQPAQATQPAAPVEAEEGPWTKYATPAPKVEESTKPEEAPIEGERDKGTLGTVAAGLRGLRRGLPFGQDIGAAAESLRKGTSFEEEKRHQIERDKALQEAHPLAYGAGEVGSFFMPLGAPAKILSGGKLASVPSIARGMEIAEKYAASKLPSGALGKMGAAGLVGAGTGAIQGLGEGESLDERIKNAKMSALIGGVGGTALERIGAGVGSVFGPTGKTATQKAAEELGMENAPRFITSESPFQQQMAATIKDAPLGLGHQISESAKKFNEELGDKLIEVAGGSTSGKKEAGQAAKEGIRGWVGSKSRDTLQKLYGAVESKIDDTVPTPVSNLKNQFEAMKKSREAALGEGRGVSPTMRIVEKAIDVPGHTYSSINDLRRELGKAYKDVYKDAQLNRDELDMLYGALIKDQGQVIKNADTSGTGQATRLFERANRIAGDIKDKRSLLRKITGVSETGKSDEAIYESLAAMAQKGKGADIKRLQAARSTMSPSQWEDVLGATVGQLGRGRDNIFSPETFITQLGKMSDDGKDVMFGPIGSPTRNNLENIATLARAVNSGAQYINRSKTAHVLQGLQTLGKIASVPFAAYEAGHGDVKGVAGEAAALGAYPLIAAMLASPRGSGAILNYLRNNTPMAAKQLLNEARIHAGGDSPKSESREERASGGKVGKRDYPAKRLNKMERAARRAQQDIALETVPLMQKPDEQIAQALRIAKGE